MKEKKIWVFPALIKLNVKKTKDNKHKSVNEAGDKNGILNPTGGSN